MRRNWTGPALGLVAVLLFGYVGTHRFHAPPPPAPPGPVPVALPRLTGDHGLGPDGLRVLVDGRFPQVLDGRTGRAAPVPGVRLAAGERVALRAVPAGMVASVSPRGAGPTRTVLLRPTGEPLPIGTDVAVLPAGTGTDLLVAARAGAGTAVRRVDRTGAVRSRWTAPAPLTLLRDTPAGLVAGRTGGGLPAGAQVLLLDPATGAVRRVLARTAIPLAVSPTAVAVLGVGCAADCGVDLVDLRTGRARHQPTGVSSPGAAAFSPDGRWLALAVPGQYRNGRLTVVPGFAEVVDLRSGAVLPVPGLETAAEHRADLSWSGSRLVLAVWAADHGSLAVWSPERPGPLRVLPADPPGDDTFASASALPVR